MADWEAVSTDGDIDETNNFEITVKLTLIDVKRAGEVESGAN